MTINMINKLIFLMCVFIWLWLLVNLWQPLRISSTIKRFPSYVRVIIIFFAHKQQIARLPDQGLKFPSESQRGLSELQVPWYSGANGRVKYDSFSSTPSC